MMQDTSLSDTLFGVAVESFFLVTVLGVVFRLWGAPLGVPKPNKILPFQRGVLMKGEGVDRILQPGSHWVSPKRTIFLCDMRPKPFQMTGLEVLTADQRWVRLSFKGETVINDPGKYVSVSGDSRGTFYVDTRQILHEFAAKHSSYAFSGSKEELAASLKLDLATAAMALGLGLIKLEVWETMLLGWHQIPLQPESGTGLIH